MMLVRDFWREQWAFTVYQGMAWSRLLSVSDTLNAPASASDQLWRISFFIKTIKSVCIEESWNGLPLWTKSSLLSCTSYSIYHCYRDRSEQRCNLTIPYIRPRWRASACLPIQPRLSLTPHCGTPEETHPHSCTCILECIRVDDSWGSPWLLGMGSNT